MKVDDFQNEQKESNIQRIFYGASLFFFFTKSNACTSIHYPYSSEYNLSSLISLVTEKMATIQKFNSIKVS